MTFNIIVKKYDHYNRAMGKHISSRREYENEMVKGGYVTFEKSQQLCKDFRDKEEKQTYSGLSKKASSLLNSVNPDKKGRIRLSDRQISAMKEVGVKFSVPDWCPKHYAPKEGGFADGK
jgi:hypothetical protein